MRVGGFSPAQLCLSLFEPRLVSTPKLDGFVPHTQHVKMGMIGQPRVRQELDLAGVQNRPHGNWLGESQCLVKRRGGPTMARRAQEASSTAAAHTATLPGKLTARQSSVIVEVRHQALGTVAGRGSPVAEVSSPAVRRTSLSTTVKESLDASSIYPVRCLRD